MNDFNVVNNPSHYCEGRKYEPRKVIRDWGLNFNLGNAVKYISRAGRKDDILQDLNKAKQYLEFEIEAIREDRLCEKLIKNPVQDNGNLTFGFNDNDDKMKIVFEMLNVNIDDMKEYMKKVYEEVSNANNITE